MKVYLKIVVVPLVFLCLSASLPAQETGWPKGLSLGVQAGSDGRGIGLMAPLGTSFRTRLGFGALPPVPYRRSFTVPEHPGAAGTDKGRDVPVDAKATFHPWNLEMFLDYYPLADNGFHITAGLLYGSRNVGDIKNLTPLPDDYNIVGLDVDGYTVKAVSNNVEGHVLVNSLRPYLGAGYDLPLGSDGRNSLSVDLGLIYWGSPKLYAPGEPLIGDWKDVHVNPDLLNGHDDGLLKKVERTFVYPVVNVHFYRSIF